jgi:hypothetical protein
MTKSPSLPAHAIPAEGLYSCTSARSSFRRACANPKTLTLRHNAGSSAKPYVDGALLAIRKVSTLVGVHRGLDVVLDL